MVGAERTPAFSLTVATFFLGASVVSVGAVVVSVVGASVPSVVGSTRLGPPVGSVEGAGSFLKQPVNIVPNKTAAAVRLMIRVILKGLFIMFPPFLVFSRSLYPVSGEVVNRIRII